MSINGSSRLLPFSNPLCVCRRCRFVHHRRRQGNHLRHMAVEEAVLHRHPVGCQRQGNHHQTAVAQESLLHRWLRTLPLALAWPGNHQAHSQQSSLTLDCHCKHREVKPRGMSHQPPVLGTLLMHKWSRPSRSDLFECRIHGLLPSAPQHFPCHEQRSSPGSQHLPCHSLWLQRCPPHNPEPQFPAPL